jgi:hypothetical protein
MITVHRALRDSIWLRLAIAAAALVVSLGLFAVASNISAGLVLGAFVSLLLMALPGQVVAKALFPGLAGGLATLLLGSLLGLLVGRLLLALAFQSLGVGMPGAIIAYGALILATLACWRPSRLKGVSAEITSVALILGLSALSILLISAPYAFIGRETPAGAVYLPYFNRDFLNHVAVVAELAREIPPQNVYLAGEAFHYYWLSHVWPASLVVTGGVTAQAALSATVPFVVSLFVAALFLLVSRFVSEDRSRAAAVAIAIVAASYIGLLFVAMRVVPGIGALLPNSSQVPYSFLSHGWFRDFLYEPHAITAVTLGVMLLFVDDSMPASGPWPIGAACGMGLLVGGGLLCDSFLGLLMAVWLTLRCGARAVKSRQHAGPAAAALAVLAAFFALGWWLGMLPSGGGSLTIGLHTVAKLGPAYYVAEAGPLFVLGLLGLHRAWREGSLRRLGPVLLFLAIVTSLSLIVRVPIEPDIALRKGFKLVQVPLTVLVGVCLARGYWNRQLRAAIAVVIAAGVTTLVTDLHQYTNVEGGAFPAPTIVGDEEMRVYVWMREQTSPDTIVQLLDVVRPGRGYHATDDWNVVGLGERRTLFANYEQPYLIQVPRAALESRRLKLERVFSAETVGELSAALGALPRHLLIVNETAPGPVEVIRNAIREGRLLEVFRSGRYVVVGMPG